jgi:hypothetical protein
MKRRLAHQAGKGPSVDRSLTAQREKREKKAEEDVLFDWGGGSDDDVDPNASSVRSIAPMYHKHPHFA